MSATALRKHPAHTAADDLLSSIAERTTHIANPYDHWVMEGMLPQPTMTALMQLPFMPSAETVHGGKRDGYNNNAFRIYFTPESQKRYPVCREVVEAFSDPRVTSAFERMTKSPISKGRLRIEYCQDADGFWLEPHVDITPKLFSLIVYLSDDPNLRDAGTDIYDDTPEHALVSTVPYQAARGMLFIPDKNTWHGFTKRPIHGVRKSLIVNYVSDDWRSKEELS